MTSPDTPSPTRLVAAQPYAKLFTSRCELPIRGFIDIFHRWVKNSRTGELLIDVHDYSHVHDGPGVILVGHACHYGMDRRDGRLGLVFRARRTDPDGLEAGLGLATRALVRACELLEADTGGAVTFGTNELLVGFEDRLHAPNTEDNFTKYEPELASFAARLFAGEARARRVGGDRDLFGALLTGTGRPLAELAAALD